MKVIGQFRELYKKENLPAIRDLISDNTISNKAAVLAYMRSCKVTAAAAGVATDVISGEPIKGELKMYTDGKYAWRSDVMYYFEKYNFDLGSEFIRYVTAKTTK